MDRFIYPIDTDQFKVIREQGKIYIDKTDLIYDLINVKKLQYVFLARPRKFGKSLLCNTFKAYFQGQKELFDGLKIMTLEQEWKRYPVLHFTMGGLKNVTISEARTKLESLIKVYENIYGRDPLSKTPGDRFRDLIHNVCKQTKEKVVVIIDEYDSPILRLLYEPEQLKDMRSLLSEFFQVLKDEGAYLKFVFITGVTKFSLPDINNIKQISMLEEYSGICGITQDELDTALRPCVEVYANDLHITLQEAYASLKKYYDGYHFSKNCHNVYNPYSLLNALCDKDIKQYWVKSGTFIHPIKNAQKYDGIIVDENEFNISCENAATFIPLLYQSGYLTIESYNPLLKSYTLHFPNLEVRNGVINRVGGKQE